MKCVGKIFYIVTASDNMIIVHLSRHVYYRDWRDMMSWCESVWTYIEERYLNHRHVTITLCIYYKGNISSVFSDNSVANAPELSENTEEMFPDY